MKKRYEIIETKTGIPTLKINDVYIYSKYDPIKGVKTFWDENKHMYENKDSIVIYGLGLGYHILELLNRVDEDFLIYVFDVDIDVYNATKSTKIIMNLINTKNVRLFLGYNKEILKTFNKLIVHTENFLIINTFLKTIPEKYGEFRKCLERFEIANMGIKKFGEKMLACKLENENIQSEDIKSFIEKYKMRSKIIVLISSGPSLTKDVLEILKLYRDKIVIFCVSRSLKMLISENLYSDMFSIIDCQDIVYEHIKGIEEVNIPMTFLNTANSLTVGKYLGEKYIFYNKDFGQDYVIDTGKSVSTAILDIALKCDPKKVIFIGQDLAYINETTHAKETICDYDKKIINLQDYRVVKSVKGDTVYTTNSFNMFRNFIENKVLESKDIEFYNYSFGVEIKGTKSIDNTELEEILKKS